MFDARSSQNDSTLLKKHTNKMFSFMTYSMISAILMGTSIGLAVVQGHLLGFLDGSLFPFSSSSPGTLNETTSTTAATQLNRVAGFIRSSWIPLFVWFLSMMMSTLFTRCYLAIASRKRSERGPLPASASDRRGPVVLLSLASFTPRVAILTSHILFTIVWVILGAVQEVEESQWTSIHSNKRFQGPPPSVFFSNVTEIPATLSTSATSAVTPSAIAALMMSPEELDAAVAAARALIENTVDEAISFPLCVVWILAILVLGVATGMLLTSCSALETHLSAEHQRLVQKEKAISGAAAAAVTAGTETQKQYVSINVAEKGEMVVLVKEKKLVKVKEDQPASQQANFYLWLVPQTPLVVRTFWDPRQVPFSWIEQTWMWTLVIFLLAVQMWFFRSVLIQTFLRRQSVVADAVATATVFSSPSFLMTFFGLVSGLAMILLGRRYIP